MNECRSWVHEPHQSKIGSSKEIVGECKYICMSVKKLNVLNNTDVLPLCFKRGAKRPSILWHYTGGVSPPYHMLVGGGLGGGGGRGKCPVWGWGGYVLQSSVYTFMWLEIEYKKSCVVSFAFCKPFHFCSYMYQIFHVLQTLNNFTFNNKILLV